MSKPPERARGAFERALAFCRAKRLFRPGDRVLVGSAAGVASLGVLGFLRLAQRDLGIAEVAVGAVDRGADDADAVADTGRFARLLGSTFYAISADQRRVEPALLALAKDQGFSRVALGHTRDDAVSRVLAQITRGGGLSGIRPFVAKRSDGIVRPFLDLREGEALELARTAGIEPPMLPPEPGERIAVESRLRAAILPRLRVETPGVDAALLSLAREVRQVLRLVRDQAKRHVGDAAFQGSRIEISAVSTPILASAVAQTTLRRLGVNPTVARAATDSLAVLLMSPPSANDYHEVVLGPGLIAAYVPERRAVAVRVMTSVRRPGERIG